MEDYQTKKGRLSKPEQFDTFLDRTAWFVISVLILGIIVFLAFGGEIRDVPVNY